MIVEYNKDEQKVPIKAWVPSKESLEEECWKQAKNLANLPFVHKWVALMPDCLTEDTEVLTSVGFKKINELTYDDEIANVNPYEHVSPNVFFSAPKDIISRPLRAGEKVFEFYIGALDKSIKVTENHRMPYIPQMGIKAKDLPKITKIGDYVWSCNGVLVDNELDISDEELCLIAWIVGDGNIKKSNKRKDGTYASRTIRFGMTKDRKVNRLIGLLDLLDVKYSVQKSNKQTVISINTSDSKRFIDIVGENKSYPSYFISRLSKRQAVLFLDEMLKVDGDYANFVKYGTHRYNSARKGDIDFISALTVLNLGLANESERTSKTSFASNSKNRYMQATLKQNCYESGSGFHESKIVRKEVEYNGDVVCVTCDTGYFIARQNGISFVTGNCHAGYGMPIGGVLPTKNVIVPNAVGTDIGCGMAYVQTNIPADLLRKVETGSGNLAKTIIGDMMRSIPVGFSKHKKVRTDEAYYKNPPADENGNLLVIELYNLRSLISQQLLEALPEFSLAFGTLGGGNHFIELQEGDDGLVGIMIHSGSRSLGANVAKQYNKIAKEINERYFSAVPSNWGLSFIPVDDELGQEYIHWMRFACEFAKRNRADMLEVTKRIVKEKVEKFVSDFEVQFMDEFDVHHNYASIENHFGHNVWVHRKGAILARKGMRGIIPGAMGSFSYLVEGLGNEDAFTTASHGAGRKMSRTKAKEQFSVQQMMEDTDFVLGTTNKEGVLDEYKRAYKDIDEVIANELDLVSPTKQLKTIAVLKG